MQVLLDVVRRSEPARLLDRSEDDVELALGIGELERFFLRSTSVSRVDLERQHGSRTKVGYLESMIDGVESFGRRGRRCQSSSVTNGMKGCSRRRP